MRVVRFTTRTIPQFAGNLRNPQYSRRMSVVLRRALAATLVATVASLSLAACFDLNAVGRKTEAIYDQLKDLPGVVDGSIEVTETSAFSPRRSAVYLYVADDLTADQAVDIITTFAHANIETGVKPVSAELHLIDETSLIRNELQVDYAPLTDATAAALGETWVELLGSTDGASITVAAAVSGYDVTANVDLPGEPTIERDLADLAEAGAIFDRIGPIKTYTQADGRFSAYAGLPGEEALAQLATLQAAAVAAGGDITAEYGGTTPQNFVKVIVPVAAATVDPANGLPVTIESVVDAIPVDAFPVLFHVNDEVESIDGVTGITFTNVDCGPYPTLVSLEPSRTLALYWARDGRTLLDGSTIESCYS